ncbi:MULTISPECIES: hypothetical protein [Streptomyces]|uniref:Uncharacterized protein n=1 Tax=Streptomyces canarius TaxID=285453 RepID=A0ABQ3DC71_9ACTN|nr:MULTISPECIES: hypothetical protein [Streptomyces]MBG7699946.1 hypothetical protein [Streptomyces sp. MC1]GHA78911.1 hypothetical protein GCM10010345_94860 [Streptomyces canarius]
MLGAIKVMNDSIPLVVNLTVVFVALAAGVRLGYVVAARGTARDVEVMDRHFEGNRRIFERQYELQFEADQKRRAREEMKVSYEALGVWLHTLDRTLDEINAGATTSRKDVRDKARSLLGGRPWEVINPPVDLASAEFYWSSETRKLLRKLKSPYAGFVSRVRLVMDTLEAAENEGIVNVDHESWEYRNQLYSIVNEIKDQVRKDLLID